MTYRALDLQYVIAAHGPPGDPRRAEIMEGHRGARLIVREQLRASHARQRQEPAQPLSVVRLGGHLEQTRTAGGAKLFIVD